ncbi:MAG: hypothetical protein CR982_07655 [Candidatus Cloacimonadota bacterium]|nr:MAG: hypothetical protein CR982_07655 [Candidatus Cloacimonadota bacterium]PIE78270.1 MAG: hypothetical protein CSA15_08885 [Candidatus Delongbacteria bacterium]
MLRIMILISLLFSTAFSEESDVLKKYLENVKKERTEYNENVLKERKLWEDYVKKERKKWKEMVSAVRGKWGEFSPTTDKIWSEYSKDFSSHSKVDFENDLIEVEVVMDDESNPNKKLQKQFDKILEEKDPYTGKPIMEDQVESENLIINNNKIKESVVIGDDGRARKKYTVSVKMAPKSLQKRAKRYMPMVEQYSKKYDLDPAMVMALIHTESAFNPKAYSRRPDGTPMACGLMQIIPTQAGRDAHKALFGSDKIVRPEFLFKPDNNIKMGTWYIKSLRKFWNRRDKNLSSEKNNYLTIISYNQGMGTILKRYKANNLYGKSAQKTYTTLNTDMNISKEGRDYIERVVKRTDLYK